MSSHGPAAVTVDDIPASEKPQNGVAGLKHWKYDLMAGLQVNILGLPISLGVKMLSRTSPDSGPVSGIIMEFYSPFSAGAISPTAM